MDESDDPENMAIDDRPANLALKADRKRGILTKEDRKYLLGEKTLEGQDEINTRYRIRQRIIQSILDMFLLAHRLDPEDTKQIATDSRIEDRDILAGVTALAYDLVYRNDDVTDPVSTFETIVGDAVSLRTSPPEDTEGLLVQEIHDVHIEIRHQEVDLEDIAGRLAELAGEDMDKQEALRRLSEDLTASLEIIESAESESDNS